MPHFIYFDPPEYDPVAVIATHEAAHAVLAYYYGFEIVRFRTFSFNGQWLGAVGVNVDGVLVNGPLIMARVRQLIAGELAARLYLGMDPDVLTLPTQNGAHVAEATQLQHVWNLLIKQPPRDLVKIFELIQVVAPPNWWQWLWDRHSETEALINQFDSQISRLARKLRYSLENPYSYIDTGISNWMAVHVLKRRSAPGAGSLMTGRYITKCVRKSGVPTAE